MSEPRRGLNQGRSEAIRRLVELGLEGEEMSRVEKAVPQICLCDAPKEQRKMEYEEILTSLELGPPTAVMRNFSIDCPIHGTRIKQFQGHHITTIRPPFSKSARKIVKQKLTGSERKAFMDYIEGKYLARDSEVARWKELAASSNPKARG